MKQVIISDLEQNICSICKIDFPNNKCYIGQSINIKRRMWEHNTPSSNKQACDLAIKKYFGRVERIVILEECLPEELDEKEKYRIKYFRANEKDFGYNLTEGGQGKTKTQISQQYSFVSYITISRVCDNITWKHVK